MSSPEKKKSNREKELERKRLLRQNRGVLPSLVKFDSKRKKMMKLQDKSGKRSGSKHSSSSSSSSSSSDSKSSLQKSKAKSDKKSRKREKKKIEKAFLKQRKLEERVRMDGLKKA